MTLSRDMSFVDDGRRLEIEAVEGGRKTNELSVAPQPTDALPAEDDIQASDERLETLGRYVPYATKAFAERGFPYPFKPSGSGVSLDPTGDHALAKRAAELSGMVSTGGSVAKDFEKRSISALHVLLGGWAAGVGAPRDDGTGPARAVEAFRLRLPEECHPFDPKRSYPPNGDLGADAFWILGRTWGGPLVYLQAKNTPFVLKDVPQEFMRVSSVLEDWFGRKLDQVRAVVRVLAVNSVFTQALKEEVFSAAGAGTGIHVIDAVDILSVEHKVVSAATRDALHLM